MNALPNFATYLDSLLASMVADRAAERAVLDAMIQSARKALGDVPRAEGTA